MPLYIAQSGDLEGCHACLTDSQTLKDRVTHYKSGALVTQYQQFIHSGRGPYELGQLPSTCKKIKRQTCFGGFWDITLHESFGIW